MSNSLFGEKSRIRTVTIVLLSIGLCVGLACYSSKLESNAQAISRPTAEHTPDDSTEKLDKFYDDKDCKEFVVAFPDTFEAFNQLYGYDDEEGPGKLYSKSEEHISYFFSCPEVSGLEKLTKAINIGRDGKWDADAIGMFQDRTFHLLGKYPDDTKEILDKLPDSQASSFWYFLLDAPHPGDPERQKQFHTLVELFGKTSKQSKLLVEQHRRILEDAKNN